jgi:hypothetical protein
MTEPGFDLGLPVPTVGTAVERAHLVDTSLLSITGPRAFSTWILIVFGWHQDLNSGSCTSRQALYRSSHNSSPFCFSYFSDRVSRFLLFFFGLEWPQTTVVFPAPPMWLGLQMSPCLAASFR